MPNWAASCAWLVHRLTSVVLLARELITKSLCQVRGGVRLVSRRILGCGGGGNELAMSHRGAQARLANRAATPPIHSLDDAPDLVLELGVGHEVTNGLAIWQRRRKVAVGGSVLQLRRPKRHEEENHRRRYSGASIRRAHRCSGRQRRAPRGGGRPAGVSHARPACLRLQPQIGLQKLIQVFSMRLCGPDATQGAKGPSRRRKRAAQCPSSLELF